jgi:hypothetical protein
LRVTAAGRSKTVSCVVSCIIIYCTSAAASVRAPIISRIYIHLQSGTGFSLAVILATVFLPVSHRSRSKPPH